MKYPVSRVSAERPQKCSSGPPIYFKVTASAALHSRRFLISVSDQNLWFS